MPRTISSVLVRGNHLSESVTKSVQIMLRKNGTAVVEMMKEKEEEKKV